jgi:hypothetical protein
VPFRSKPVKTAGYISDLDACAVAHTEGDLA